MLKYFFILLLISFSFTQTTGKISGLVADKKTNDPLPGANIYLQGTVFGTASGTSERRDWRPLRAPFQAPARPHAAWPTGGRIQCD